MVTRGGEEWFNTTLKEKGIDPVQWKNLLKNEVMIKYIKKDSTILEIGPGGGRWTEILQPLANKLIIADISKKCIEICKKRFELKNNIEYKLIKKRLDFIDDNVIDYIWSYAVFVHINPSDIERYLEDFSRILKPGGYATINHSGTYSEYRGTPDGWRAYLGAKQFAELVTKHKLKIVEQTKKLVRQGDIISVIIKPLE